MDVYRAPMRSRDDAVAYGPAVARALANDICGVGGRLLSPPSSLDDAISGVAAAYDERVARRLARFAAGSEGSFVWTRDPDRMLWLGRLAGAWNYDASPEAFAADLVHTRPCEWITRPFGEWEVPASVNTAFDRGGRNWQRIRAASAGTGTVQIWSTYAR